MVSECSNPACRVPFLYLRDGRVFTLRRRSPLDGSTVEHFWLCGSCAEYLSIRFESNGAASVVGRSCSRVHERYVPAKMIA
jgi:hypothetical protein